MGRITTSAGERNLYKLDKLPTKMLNNNVLVGIDDDPSGETVRPSGIILSGMHGVEWKDADYLPRYGVVVSIPDRLVNRTFANMDSDGLMEWGTEMEVKVGDTVYFGAMISANANAIEVDDVMYLLVPYSRLILKATDEELYPLNGNILMEEVITTVNVDGLILDFDEKVDRKSGTVLYTGRKNDWYFGTDQEDADVCVGDSVMMPNSFFGHIEHSTFAKLPKGIGYCQGCWINGIYED